MENDPPFGTQTMIEESIMATLDIYFGRSEPIDKTSYEEKLHSAYDFAFSASGAYLSPETTRYQTMLLTLSLFLLAVHMFSLASVKVFDNVVKVDSRVLLAYVALLWSVAVIFLCKVTLDRKRSNFMSAKSVRAIVEVQMPLDSAMGVRQIQHYFWLKISGRIAQTRDLYHQAKAELKHSEKEKDVIFPEPELNRRPTDKEPELKVEFERLHAYLDVIVESIEKDEMEFRRRADIVLGRTNAEWEAAYGFNQAPSGWETLGWTEIIDDFGETLGKWLEARTALHLRALNVKDAGETILSESSRIYKLLRDTWRMRRVYSIIEVLVPILFALTCTLFSTYHHAVH